MSLEKLTRALPHQFTFYHLGEVQLMPNEEPLEQTVNIAFQISGDLHAWIIVRFPKDLDHSTYAELGNILASQLTTQLYRQEALEVQLSPPHTLTDVQLERLLQTGPFIRKTYAHLYKNSFIPLNTIILPSPSDGVGYA